MAKQINNQQPINVCGDKIWFWLEGNNKRAETNIDENFNVVKKIDRSKKLLTFEWWIGKCKQDQGYTRVYYGPGDDRSFNLFPDGSTSKYSYVLPGQYRGAKFVPLNKQEMDYVRSRVIVAADADNVVEYRYEGCFGCIGNSIHAYYVDTSTGEMLPWCINLADYIPEEDGYVLSERYRINALFNKNLRPATKEELADIIAAAKQEDKKAVNYSKKSGRELPMLASEDCAEIRQEYLDSLNNHNNDSPAQPDKGRQF